MNRAQGSNAANHGQDFEDLKMDLQLDQNISHDDDDTVDHARLERLFSRRAQKADTYRRILLTTCPTIFSHQAG